MNRILYVATRFHTNQVQALKSLMDNGAEVRFVSHYTQKTENYAYLEPMVLGYSPIFIKLTKLLKIDLKRQSKLCRLIGFPPITKLARIMDEFQPDLLVSRDCIFYSLISMYLARLRGIKVVLYVQVPEDGIQRNLPIMLTKTLLSKYVMTPIKGKKERSGLKNVFFVPLVIDKNRYLTDEVGRDREIRSREGKVNIIMVAEFSPRKQILEFLEVIKRLTMSRHGIRVKLIGNATKHYTRDYLDRVVGYIDENGLRRYVDVDVNLSHEEVLKEYVKNDIFVLSSKRESAGFALLEAMSSGLAVVCTSSTGLKEYIVHGESGFVFHSNRFDELYTYLKKLLEDPEMVKAFGEKNIDLIEDRYRSRRYYEAISHMWDQMNRG